MESYIANDNIANKSWLNSHTIVNSGLSWKYESAGWVLYPDLYGWDKVMMAMLSVLLCYIFCFTYSNIRVI